MRGSPMNHGLRAKVRELGGTMPDPELAKRLGRSTARIRQLRVKLGIPAWHGPHCERTEAELDALITQRMRTLHHAR